MHNDEDVKLVTRGTGAKEISQVEKDGFLFLIAEFLFVAFGLSIGVSWGVVSMQFSSIPLLTTFFTWLFWIVGILGLFIYTPCMCWWAYKKGVWDSID